MNATTAIAAIALCSNAALSQSNTPAPPRETSTNPDRPNVQNKDDFLNLSRDEQERYLRFERPKVSILYGGTFTYRAEGDFDESAGAVSRGSAGGNLGVAIRLSNEGSLILSGSVEYGFYEFEEPAGFVSSDPTLVEPFDHYIQYRFTPTYRHTTDDWLFLAGGRLISSGETDANFDETMIYGGFVAARYTFNPRLKLGLGVSVRSEFEGEVFAIPIPIFEVGFTDRLTLEGNPQFPGVQLNYALDEQKHWKLGLLGSFNRRRFRLDDNGPVPNGIVTDSAFGVLAGLTYSPSPGTLIQLYAGADVWGEIDLDDQDADDLTERQIEPTPSFGFTFRLSF